YPVQPIIRKAVPLAIGLVSASNLHPPILDTLSKYSHADNDLQVAMGLVGAGTNNACLSNITNSLRCYPVPSRPIIWKAVPLTIGLVSRLSTSNLHLPILDTLSKYGH